MEVERSGQARVIIIWTPPLSRIFLVFVLVQEFLDFGLTQRLTVLLIGAALLPVDSGNVLSEEGSCLLGAEDVGQHYNLYIINHK